MYHSGHGRFSPLRRPTYDHGSVDPNKPLENRRARKKTKEWSRPSVKIVKQNKKRGESRVALSFGSHLQPFAFRRTGGPCPELNALLESITVLSQKGVFIF